MAIQGTTYLKDMLQKISHFTPVAEMNICMCKHTLPEGNEKLKKTLVIVGHPDLNGDSLANRIIIDRLKLESDVEIRNLAELYPNFAIDVAAEQDALLRADTIVL